jgi:hypothetical protein
MTMFHLAALLDEPADGATVILDFGEVWEVFRRMDDTAKDFTDTERERWFRISAAVRTPITWDSAVFGADAVYALGDLLADAESPTDTDRCTRCGGAFPREYLWVLRGGYGPQGAWRGGYYCRDCCISTTGREPEVSA